MVGPQSYHRLPALLARAAAGEPVVDTEFPAEDKFGALPQPSRQAIGRRGVSAFLTVQEGCDKFCTFCVVPYTRGAEFSRPVAQVLAEAERLAAAGVREITVIGQNVNAYHGAGPDGAVWSLARLLHRPGGNSRPGALALHHQPPRRHGRRTDWRRMATLARTDAVPASAGAVGVRPRARRDEPPAHRRRLSATGGAAAAGAAGANLLVGFHRRISRARPTPNSAPRSRWWKRWVSSAPSRSNIRRAPARPPPPCRRRCPRM